MAYVSLSKMPDPKKEYIVSFENLSGGLNLQELDYRIDNNETPEMKNLLWREGVLSCRDGQVWVNDEEYSDGFYTAYNRLWNGQMFLHAGNKIWADDPETGEWSLLYTGGSDMTTRGTFFKYGENLYYKTTGYYIEITYDSSTETFSASAVTGYVPITYINCTPQNGSGTAYQPENRISSQKTLWYTAEYTITSSVSSSDLSVSIEDSYFRYRINTAGSYVFTYNGTDWVLDSDAVDLQDYGITLGGTPASGDTITVTLAFEDEYYLPLTGADIVSITVDGVAMESETDYTYDSTTGLVTFVSAPVLSYPEITNTVVITYSLENAEAMANIMDCRYAEVYGGTGSLCVVVAGCDAQPNAYFWNGQTSVAMDPAYFPMTQYQLAGDGVDPISGFGKQQGYLIIFKENSIGRTSLETATVDDRLTIDLPYTAINAKIGCDLPWTIQLIENNLTWCNTSQGIHFLANTSAAYENNVVCLSQKVNESSQSWTKGLLYDVRNSDADVVVSHDDDKRYWLVANGHAWLWDYNISNYKSPAWFYFDNINGVSFIQEYDDIWHFDAQGRLTLFERAYYDYLPDDDEGGIDKVFRFASQYFGTYDNLKTVNSVIINMRSDTNSLVSLEYITDYETREDLSPLQSMAWMLVPRNLSFRMLRGSGFSHVFRRKPHCRRVHYFTMRLRNTEPTMDMSIVSAQIYYTYQGRFR